MFDKKQRLDNLFEKVAGFSDDLELQSHWAAYLCVLVSGYIETSVQEIYSDYSIRKSDVNVARFVQKNLKFFNNPKMDKILNLTRKFNIEWEKQLQASTEGELKDSIDTIVANRNRIAHGENVGITYVRIKTYYINAKKVIKIIEKKVND